MEPCECLPRCIFFNNKMQNAPSTAEMMKKRYCLANFEVCARHKVFKVLGGAQVPGDMFPNQIERAEKILAAVRA